MRKDYFKITAILIAAFMLSGCGNDVSEEKSLNSTTTSEGNITIVGATEGLSVDEADIGEDEILEDEIFDIESIQDDDTWENEVDEGFQASGKRIVCWGDSLTEGTGGEGMDFPKRLAELTGMEVLNYGVFSERAGLIAARQGGNPVHIEECDEIPADTTPVKVAIVNDNDGNWEMWCNFGDAGINPCEIAGVKGTLAIDESIGGRTFTRLEPGDAVALNSENNKLTTFAMQDKRDDDILVIWSGSSDRRFDDRNLDDVINHQKSMIDYANCSEYIIIGFTTKLNGLAETDEWNQRLKQEYGDKFVDARGYLIKYGLEDAGITPTQQDKLDISEGRIPQSLRVDESHGTADFYRIIGDLVYKRMVELGYLTK